MNVKYWEVSSSDKKSAEKNYVCFAHCDYKNSSKIYYSCPIHQDITEPMVRMWIRLMKRFLTDLKWNYRRITSKDGMKTIFYVLHKNDAPQYKTLLYLTAFRYLDEYSGIIRALYDKRNSYDTPNDMFIALQELHGDKDIKPRSGPGHALYASRTNYGYSDGPISLDKFRDNLKAGSETVQGFFKK